MLRTGSMRLAALLPLALAACGDAGGSGAPRSDTGPDSEAGDISGSELSVGDGEGTDGTGGDPSTGELPWDCTTNGFPATVAGAQACWFFEQILEAPLATRAEVGAHMSESFLSQVPYDALVEVVAPLREDFGPFEIGETWLNEPARVQVLVLAARDAAFVFDVTTGPEPLVLIDGALIMGADHYGIEAPRTWPEIEDDIAASGVPDIGIVAAELVDGTCTPLHSHDADRRLALGSAFKLYVLSELVRVVRAGERGWDDPLAIRDEWKSLPSGSMQYEEAGTLFPLRQFALQMISESDNTATDHLLHTLGRQNVEAMLTTAGHSAPEMNIPFLSTRELFALKTVYTDEERDAYLSRTEEEQRDELEGPVAQIALDLIAVSASGWDEPRYIDSLEWFASPNEICSVFSTLRAEGEAPGGEAVMEILSFNPGLAFDPRVWTWVGFKGGSEPGVVTLNWMLRRSDDRWFVVAAHFNDTEADIPSTVYRIAGSAVRLLERE